MRPSRLALLLGLLVYHEVGFRLQAIAKLGVILIFGVAILGERRGEI
jgi:hypothetical protein